MYDAEIHEKIAKLPEDLQREILDFIEFLTAKYAISRERWNGESKNPLMDIAGFSEIGEMDSADIDKEIYKL